jgi:alkylhydroperoxidase family enzyme
MRRQFDSIMLLLRPRAHRVSATAAIKSPGKNPRKQAEEKQKIMARIDYSDPSRASDRTREILGKNRNANIFRMMAHSPSYFEQYCRLGGAIRHKGELDPVVRELAITRTGILCEAPYEIVAHKRIGKNVGVTDEQNEALADWEAASCFDETQRAALAFTDEIVRLKKPTDATFKAIAARLTPAALVELQLAVGFYIMTSKFLETFEIDPQPVADVVG